MAKTKKARWRAPFKSVADVHWEREKFDYDVDAFLRSRGWEHTSETPGSLWLWVKTVEWKRYGRAGEPAKTVSERIMTGRKTALAIEGYLEDDGEE